MHARPRSIAALVVALLGTAVGARDDAAAARRPRPRAARHGRADLREARAPQRRHHPHPGLPDSTHREKPPKPVPGVKITVEDDSRQGGRRGHQRRDRRLRHRAARASRSTTSARPSRSRSTRRRCPRAPRCATRSRSSLKRTLNLDADVFVTFPIGDDDRRRDRQGHPGAAARGRRPRVLAAAGDGRARPVDDLRHDGADQLRPRRADHLRRARRLRRGPAARGRSRSAARTSPSPSPIVVAAIASAGFGWLKDRALWRPLRRRGTGLIAMMIVSIGLSIFLRNLYQYFAGAEQPPVLPVLAARAVAHRARSLVTPEGRLRRRSFSRVVLVVVVDRRCSAPGSARPPARSPTTRRWPPPPASTSTG